VGEANIMAYLLRFLIVVMVLGIALTIFIGLGWVALPWGHIQIAIASFLFLIFIQAFVMFYFIGVSRLVDNVWMALNSTDNLHELFDTPPTDLEPYKKKVARYVHESTLGESQLSLEQASALSKESFVFLKALIREHNEQLSSYRVQDL
jgi:ABC-type multidrug transport system fused ATPase/permease subunit